MTSGRARGAVATGLAALAVVALVAAGGLAGATAGSAVGASATAVQDDADANVSEEAYVEPAPEEGDLYYEASDGNWVSYVNPRDEYRSPYLGDGSGKIGVTLLNEAGEPIVGETVPNTTIVVPTGETTSWHSHADPLTVELPMTDHYERPLDGDQIGTTDDLPQGDGYMDSHTIELHGHPEDATIEYGEARVEGEHADKIEVVGYIQQAHDTWDTDVDPIEDAESYAEAGGGWTYKPGSSHGEVLVVLQLDSDVTGADGEPIVDDPADGNETDENDTEEEGIESVADSEPNDGDDEMPGFGVPVAVVALTAAALFARRSSD